jgi:hypothetical protein
MHADAVVVDQVVRLIPIDEASAPDAIMSDAWIDRSFVEASTAVPAQLVPPLAIAVEIGRVAVRLCRVARHRDRIDREAMDAPVNGPTTSLLGSTSIRR